MPEPTPFEPLWSATAGGVQHLGKGLLSGEARAFREGLDRFTVKLPNVAVSVQPKTGTVLLDNTPAAVMGKANLLWFRRMGFQIGTHDQNHAKADCLWYGLGLENDRGIRFGYRIFEDGRLVPGLPT